MSEEELKKMFEILDIIEKMDIQLKKSIKIVYLPHILSFEDSITHLN